MNWKPVVAAALLVLSSVGAGAVAAADTSSRQQASAYSGAHVSFGTNANAVTDYSVSGTTMVDSVAVQSQSEAESKSSAEGGVAADVGRESVTSFAAADVDVAAKASTHATVQTDSGAEMRAHDNDRGVLVVDAESNSQYVRLNVTSDSEAKAMSDQRVVVTNEDGTKAVAIVAGDGSVVVNDGGNVSAKLSEDAELVYRQYAGERSESEKQQEELIASGEATAEVYYQQAEDGSGKVVDVVNYGQNTTVETTAKSEQKVSMEVSRAKSEGKVVIVSVSDAAMENADDVQVTVDGEAAAQASSYSEVKSASNGGDTSKYIVRQSSSAQASSDVVVGINHFSTRDMTVSSGEAGGGDADSSDGSSGDSDSADDSSGDTSPTSGNGPGFGVAAALVALAGAALVARTRS